MSLKKEFSDLRLSFEPLTLYQKFEQVCVLLLTTLIAIIIALALWNLTLKILLTHEAQDAINRSERVAIFSCPGSGCFTWDAAKGARLANQSAVRVPILLPLSRFCPSRRLVPLRQSFVTWLPRARRRSHNRW